MDRRKFMTMGIFSAIAAIVPKRKLPEIEMVEISAEDWPWHIDVFFNGENVSDECNRAYLSPYEGREVFGWVDLLVIDERGKTERGTTWATVKIGSDGEVMVYRQRGEVMWKFES